MHEMPKRTKYRKMMRGRMTGKANRGVEISFGEFALQGDGAGLGEHVRSKRPVVQ